MITTQTLLTFDELRDKCLRHLQEVTALCPGGFTNPDPDFLNDEFSAICEDLRNKRLVCDRCCLVNAFWSAVFELEHKQKLLPNSLVVLQRRLCRIIKFFPVYPVKIEYRVFTKHGNGRLKNVIYSTILNQPIQRVLLIDPLTKNQR
ncbi:hypothetical protein H6G76_36270 [Nostoc sp. FACHB-152]|uniref:hypothetical protein n=1 Tax=unclassified Nostoc TaxID=2593658 RepID=UPI0016894C78|nr:MULTISPECIES: hypothetical protein [unclassified Nostoc]MBD2452459.1 hypothetical protein [Nostoc sp. FACHB-152]MBD2473374.1 hypothetical protein [Nostoc sp. FACHB-145]